MTQMNSTLADSARWYAENGFPIFPLVPGKKNPLTERGFKDASTDAATVDKWWEVWPTANIGMATGKRSGLCVVDVDPRNGGTESLESLLHKHGPFPDTAQQETGGGGRHFVFTHNGGPFPKTLAPGIDIKGDGGYIVVAPSIHPSGKAYDWDGIEGVTALLHPAPLPAWVLNTQRAKGTERAAPIQSAERWGTGKRNDKLTSAAGTMRWRGLSEDAILAALLVTNAERCDPPLSEAEVRGIAESVGRYVPGQSAEDHHQQNPESVPLGIAETPSIFSFDETGITWAVEGFIPLGAVTMLSGDSGLLKSTVMTAAGRATADGDYFAGMPTTKRDVVILDRGENGLAGVQDRYRRLGFEDGKGLLHVGSWSGDVPTPGSAQTVEYVMASNPKPMIVVDSLISHIDGGDENNSVEMRAFMNTNRYLATLGAAVVVLHHTGKAGSKYRGSSDIKAAVDVAYEVLGIGDPTRLEGLKLIAFKNRIATRQVIKLKFDGGQFSSEDVQPPMRSNMEQLRDLLIANPAIKAADFYQLAVTHKLGRDRAREFLLEGRLNDTIKITPGPKNAQFHTWVGNGHQNGGFPS